MNRVVAWFSCGAASAVAAKLAVEKYGDRCVVVYCDTSRDEHPDNARFFEDVQGWLGIPITRLHSEKYSGLDEVFSQRRYMAGIAGAICTTELKKLPRFAFQRPDDIHVFGYHGGEGSRIVRFTFNNPELECDWLLYDQEIDKAACQRRLIAAGIELPAMYALGYKNNNCLGCVKATSPKYWNAIRRDFPEVYAKRAEQSRELGARLVRVDGVRVFLDELPAEADGPDEDVPCGPECGVTK